MKEVRSGFRTSMATYVPEPEPTSPQAVPMPMPQPAPYTAAYTVEETSAMSGALADLAPMNARLDSGPNVAKTERKLDTIGFQSHKYWLHNFTHPVVSPGNTVNNLASEVSPAVAFLKTAASTDLAQQIEQGIQRFADNVPWLMKSLDELARIHPAVTVAVLAFKAVYALESTRQENDRRVVALYVEMKDMMMVMVQLKAVESRVHIGLDGRVLKDRLEELAEKTASDIKECANVCDTFLKKRLLVKVFKGPVWAERLAVFVQVFEGRKADFQFTLTMHTANSLTDVKRQNYEIQAKLDAVLALFQRLASPEERKIASEVESNGGATKVRKDDDVLRSLMAMDASMHRDAPEADQKEPKAAKHPYAMSGKQKPLMLDQFKMELREDVDDSLERNFETFIGKFDLQVSLLQVALERYIHAENDRVIGAVTDVVTQGPHMKIKDPELRKIWQEMNWRGNVKARLFAMTLQDHYRDEFELATHAPDAISTDNWALKYLSTDWLPSIMEAFDDDASGYVTITEVNKLMDLRPPSLSWSVLHWLAYLAIGWRMAANTYIRRIQTILTRMQETIPTVLPVNRNAVDSYLEVWSWIFMLLHGVSMNLDDDDAINRDRFQEYIDMEEQRIRENLRKVKYAIDASDTLFLVIGAGNLDKAVWPLLFLLLENDWIKFSAARTHSLTRAVFTQAHDTILQVFNALNDRGADLERRFVHQKLDLKTEFKSFACGLYSYIKNHGFWDVENKTNPEFFPHIPDGELPYVDDIPEEIIKNKAPGLITTAYDTIDEESEEDLTAPEPLKSILGRWNGFAYTPLVYPTRSMLSFRFHLSHADNEDFTAEGVEFDGDSYTVRGHVARETGGMPQVEWTVKYPGGYDVRYFGSLTDEFTIMGCRSISEYDMDWQFVLKKIPAEYMIYRPSPYTLNLPTPYRELWRYAISATLHDVRRKWWTWTYFAARRDARKNFLNTHYIGLNGFFPPNEPEPVHTYQANQARLACTAADAQFYESLAVYLSNTRPSSVNMWCSAAGDMYPRHWVSPARLICLDCEPDPTQFCEWVVFCDNPLCYSVALPDVGFPPHVCAHDPTHDFVKVRTTVHGLEWGLLRWRAIDGINRSVSCENPPRDLPPSPPSAERAEGKSVSDSGARGSLVDAQGANHGAEEDAVGQVSSSPNTASRPHDVGAISPRPRANMWRPPADKKSCPPPSQAGVGAGPLAAPGVAHWPEVSTTTTAPLLCDEGEAPNMDVPCATYTGDCETLREAMPGIAGNLGHSEEEHPDAAPINGWATSGPGILKPSIIFDRPIKPPQCLICHEEVFMGRSWYCLDCASYICDDCELKTLITCQHCKKPFPQPQWYYGNGLNDFICDMCWARGLKGPDPSTVYWGLPRHVYTHPLVKCKRRDFNPPEPEPNMDPPLDSPEASMDRRLASVEERLSAMDVKFERLQGRFDELEEQLSAHFQKMQEALLERFAETLTNVLPRNMNAADGQSP
ncbi:hypothetical protein LXA43DRAFT_899499 [Ganoderma leucocontextum]|nr:hypothetical protein LXA43DRAFT_899499 [Ganoderma leucocontextum]